MKAKLKIIRKHVFNSLMEFLHIEIVNGKNKFKFSSKKFWFQEAQVQFVFLLFYSIYGNRDYADYITVEVLAIAQLHAIATGTWYLIGKKKDIANAYKEMELTE